MSDKNYIVACNADYDRRVFMIAMFYQDPDTGECVLDDDDGITEITHDSFMSMSKDEFMAEFDAWSQSQNIKH
jgi:hypothetical protein